MAVFTDGTFTFSAVDYSDESITITLNYGAEEVEDTVMGDATRSAEGGLNNWDATIETTGSEAAAGALNDLFSLVGTTATFTTKPTSAATAATNPEYSGTALLTSIDGIVSGTVGDRKTATLNFVAAGDLSRNTS